MIFGNWRPGGLAAGAGLFGYTDALQLRGGGAVHALLLLTAILLAGYGALAALQAARARRRDLARDRRRRLLLVREHRPTSPPQVAFVTPYVVTLLVLSLASQRLRMPAADGQAVPQGRGALTR